MSPDWRERLNAPRALPEERASRRMGKNLCTLAGNSNMASDVGLRQGNHCA